MLDLFQHLAPSCVIDRAPIIRIDQTVIPKFGALINIRHTGRGKFDRDLRQRIDCAEPRDFFCHRQKQGQEFIARARLQNPGDEIHHGVIPVVVRLNPARIQFCFLQRLRHVSLDAANKFWADRWRRHSINIDWPGPEQSLIQQVFLSSIRRLCVVDLLFEAAIGRAPLL